MKRLKLNFAIILGFATLFLFSGCYTQFSKVGEPGDQVYYEESQGSEDSGYYPATADDGYYADEGSYSEAEPNQVIIEEYYYGAPFSIYYDPFFYNPYPYSGVSFRYVVSDPYWAYAPTYWYPGSYRLMAHYPYFVDFDFYFGYGYWDPWYATIYFPPVVVYMPPYYPIGGWWNPCWPHPHYDPWDNGHHHNSGNGDPNEGRRDWNRRDPVIATGHSGTVSGGSHVQGGNSGNNGGRPPRESTITTATHRNPVGGSGSNIQPVKTKENGRGVEVKKEKKGVAVNSGKGQVSREPVKVSPEPQREPVKLSPRTNQVNQNKSYEPAKPKTSTNVQSQKDSSPKNPNKSTGYQTGKSSKSKASGSTSASSVTPNSRKSYESSTSGSSSNKKSQSSSNSGSYRNSSSSSGSSNSSYRSQPSSSGSKSSSSSLRSTSSSGSKSSGSSYKSSGSSASRSSSQSARSSSGSSKTSSSRSSSSNEASKTRR